MLAGGTHTRPPASVFRFQTNHTTMKKLSFLFIAIVGAWCGASAQTFTQHLQQSQTGKGKVTVTQSAEITKLVNGTAQATTTATTPTQAKTQPQASAQQKATPQKTAATTQKTLTTTKKPQDDNHYIGQPKKNASQQTTADKDSAAKAKAREQAKEEERKAAEARQKAEAQKAEAQRQAQEHEDDEMSIPTVDMRKKVMRGSHKVTGYRVQAYAGGNKRTDKQKAQQVGDAIKMSYPDQPVYVHFYSPRWICRVGNYRTYDEAARMLKAVKAMGYKTATIVKGKITVFD